MMTRTFVLWAPISSLLFLGLANALQMKYANLLTQCPLTSWKNPIWHQMEHSTTVLNAVMANSSEANLNAQQLLATEYLDYTSFVGNLKAEDFAYQQMHPYWTAKVTLTNKPKVLGPGGPCDLDAIDLLPGDDSTGRLTAVELRFVLENCENGKHGVVSTYIVPQHLPGILEEKSLIPWMCAVRGRDCGTEEQVAEHAAASLAAANAKTDANIIKVKRVIKQELITHPDGTSGKCNNTNMGTIQRDATTEDGCRLECIQRLELDVAKSDVDVMHECSGYTWKEGNAATGVSPVCLMMYELPHSDKAVTSADMDHSWKCVGLRIVVDDYQHSTATTTTSGAPTTTTTHDLSLTPLNLYSLTAEPTMATRKIISPIPGWTGSCFETSDWYVIDRQVYVRPEHWKSLTLELLAQPVATMPPTVPSEILLDRVCVMGQNGVLPAECTTSFETMLFPLSLFLNALLLGLILAYLIYHYCCQGGNKERFVRVKEIVYEDGTHAAYPFAGTQQSILPGGQHEYVFRDKRMGGQ